MSRWRILVLAVMATPLLLFGLTSAAYAIDKPDSSTVARGTMVGGLDVGGKSRDEVAAILTDIASKVPTTPLTISTPDFDLEAKASDLGVGLNVDATLDSVMRQGRNDPWPLPPLRWAKSFVADRAVPLQLAVDRTMALTTIGELAGDRRVAMVEPTITADIAGLTAVPGIVGTELDVNEILRTLPTVLDAFGSAITIRTEQVTTKPSVPDDAVRALVDSTNAATDRSIELKIGDRTETLDAKALRPAMSLAIDGSTPRIALDDAAATALIRGVARTPANPTGVRFSLQNGLMVPVAGSDAVVCCAEGTATKVLEALRTNQSSVAVETTTVTAAQGVEWAKTLGVKEVVGSFTTRHAAGQPRVKNIHRISDITQGVLIAPGETFSVNDFVGRRTAEKGFVSAPVIEEGQFSTDIGGGVSQYATTLFNAAFFAGLDIPDHKAHSIYISRYPFGREATLAYPSVDLKVHNDTPWGVVIWPTYTASSVTVDLWSTRWATGAQTAQNKKSGCGLVTTTRTVTYVSDGHTTTDKFTASYNCNPPAH